MINYTSHYQAQFEDFANLCQLKLDPDNRWIQLGALLPWDRMVEVYAKRFSLNMGAGAVNPRQATDLPEGGPQAVSEPVKKEKSLQGQLA